MKYNMLTDYIKVYRNFFDANVGVDLINHMSTEEENWHKHTWSYREESGAKLEYATRDNDLSVSHTIPTDIKNYLNEAIVNSTERYCHELKTNTLLATTFSEPRVNRYLTGTEMAEHHDNIVSLFEKGVGSPTLTYLMGLNDDYTGGELIMFDNLNIKLNSGDLMIFPSSFMYTHRVEKVLTGERWSIVVWGF